MSRKKVFSWSSSSSSKWMVTFGLVVILVWAIIIVVGGSLLLGHVDKMILGESSSSFFSRATTRYATRTATTTDKDSDNKKGRSEKTNQQRRNHNNENSNIHYNAHKNSILSSLKEKEDTHAAASAVIPPWWDRIPETRHKVNRRSSSDDNAPGRQKSHPDGLNPEKQTTTAITTKPFTSTTINTTTTTTTTTPTPSHKDGWFPKRGSEEFARQCSWTVPPRTYNNCTILARPTPEYVHEGISHWMAAAVTGHIVAQELKCHFLFDYGPNIQMEQILVPHHPQHEQTAAEVVDWRVPSGFRCRRDSSNPCFPSPYQVMNPSMLDSIQQVAKTKITIPKLPTFRWPYKSKTLMEQNDGFQDVSHVLAGFHLESAMACSFESLFQLSPQATMFQPDLFTHILPTLRATNVLTIAIYIRTGHAEKEPTIAEGFDMKAKTRTERVLQCVLQWEQNLLSSNATTTSDHSSQNIPRKSYSRVVWMLVTDSPFVKDLVKTSYDKTNITMTAGTNHTPTASSLLYAPYYPRSVIVTQSRGAHTKSMRSPSTMDFAEAFIDWYVIGEADIVISEDFAPSFGDTAVFRTLRPYYKANTKHFDNSQEKCTKLETSFKL